MWYSAQILLSAGLSYDMVPVASSLIEATEILGILISLTLVERKGRNFLLILGLIVCASATLSIAILMPYQEHTATIPKLLICAMGLFMMGFAIGPGAIPYVMIVLEIIDEI